IRITCSANGLGPEILRHEPFSRGGSAERSALRDNAEPIRPTATCGNIGGVMRVGLITFHGSPRAPTSVCDHMKLQTFFDGAGFALCCGPRRVGRDMPVGLLLV